uniref:Uncharacterized protein n=1 Tax=Nelumbo nucifera TaxID=4432 RepID=A0A822YI11_NELNU|nr:TPA_asm: hypothetical protein HUJ06_011008 [Nelumbo nucifera]
MFIENNDLHCPPLVFSCRSFHELDFHKDVAGITVQWKEIEEHFYNLERMLKERSVELEAKEKEFKEKESVIQLFLAEREVAVAAKEQASVDRVQAIKETAADAIAEAREKENLFLESVNVAGNRERKDSFVDHSALCSPRKGRDDCHINCALSLQEQRDADRVPKQSTDEVSNDGITPGTGAVSFCSGDATRFQYEDFLREYSGQGTQQNDCICSNKIASEVKNDVVGIKELDAHANNLVKCPTLSTKPINVKTECSDGDLLSPYKDDINCHDHVPKPNAIDVFTTVDSGKVQNAGGCKNENLPSDCNSQGDQDNSLKCSNKMISEANALVVRKNVDFHVRNLLPHPTLLNSSVKVKVECSDEPLTSQQTQHRDYINGYAGGLPGKDDAEVPKSGTMVDSGIVAKYSQNANGYQYEDLPGNCNIQGTWANDYFCSRRVTAPVVRGSAFEPEKMNFHAHNLPQNLPLSTFPVKVKVEYPDNFGEYPFGDGINFYAGRILEVNTAEVPINKDTIDLPGGCNRQVTQTNKLICSDQMTLEGKVVGPNSVTVHAHNLPQHPQLSTFPVKVKIEHLDNNLVSSQSNCIHGSASEDKQLAKVNSEIHGEFGTDDYDHIGLKEKQRMLLSRNPVGMAAEMDASNLSESVPLGSFYLMKNNNQLGAGVGSDKSGSVDRQSSVGGNYSDSIPQTKASKIHAISRFNSSGGSIIGVSCTIPQCSPKASNCRESHPNKPTHVLGVHESNNVCSTQMSSTEFKSLVGEKELVPVNNRVLSSTSLIPLGKVKVEELGSNLQVSCKNVSGSHSNVNMLVVKSELEMYDGIYDQLDHMPLRERMEFLVSRKFPKLDCPRNLKHSRKDMPNLGNQPPASENTESGGINRRRKRKKTATDSVETALEEDAPGLLQVLVDRGVTVDEIKLYGNMDEEDALDDSLSEDSFVELEAVISKIFSERSSLLKFAPMRCTRGSKVSYCLACLVSLVEQTRYLQFRKWPVEWGWCRDLQSFIFVFERHNRIVLERPEYGYATYFFELVKSLPIDWQIKRLVTTMKLANFSRITLIENKSLLVGEDLAESEAKVLEEYGWTPNTGLGSMLNYCDRVYHDRKNEKDGSEWRSKIGKLLMNGYNGGNIVLTNLPKKVIGYKGIQNTQMIGYSDAQSTQTIEYPQIKLEL